MASVDIVNGALIIDVGDARVSLNIESEEDFLGVGVMNSEGVTSTGELSYNSFREALEKCAE